MCNVASKHILAEMSLSVDIILYSKREITAKINMIFFSIYLKKKRKKKVTKESQKCEHFSSRMFLFIILPCNCDIITNASYVTFS